jgi:Amt family ammonium transporter
MWDALVTFVILKVISFFTPLRMSDEECEVGDLAVHGEEAYPETEGVSRVLPGYGEAAGVPVPTAGSVPVGSGAVGSGA